ncbi:hypothetical protein [Pseudomonas sp. LBUM920]|uniref:hypothetical protein n=1 Tax=Pseudomonas sp. LBUM920 TaxID=2126069 RepID=UPI000F570C2C|nr:hypothetical protein [Pseudomonas sp. LBUM920]AZF62220.1 hypothetical protein C4J83_1215 [Pseudomonas sp. LBUM920]
MINLDKLEQKRTTDDITRDEAYADSVAYIQSTDWQVIAKYERNRSVPADVQAKREAALDIVTAETIPKT